MKKLLTKLSVCILAVCIAVSSLTASAASNAVGDINGDGDTAAADTVALRRYVLGLADASFISDNADVNLDGAVDIKDLVALKKHIVWAVVYVSDSGSDINTGLSKDAPLKSFSAALERVSRFGTVSITDSCTLSSSFSWQLLSKDITVTGGTLDASALSTLKIGNDVTFDNMTLTFKAGAVIYAAGNSLKIDSDVTVNGTTTLYGGDTSAVESTDVTLLSGNFTTIYGGGNGAGVTGNTNLYVGGNVNPGIDVADHGIGINIYGGCNNAVVSGDTYVTIADNARSSHVLGAGIGGNSNVLGTTHVYFTGGDLMSIYGGGRASMATNTQVIMTGGNVEQVFGGSESASFTGSTDVQILGGTVTRRIYGGCYNEAVRSGLSLNWSSTHHVTGTTTVTIGEGANITLSYSDDERGIFACSRYKSLFGDEYAKFVFTSTEAYNSYYSKLGPDGIAAWLLFVKTPYNEIVKP